MSAATVELHEAVITVWLDELDDYVKAYWSEADRTAWPSIHDTEATPGQPFPYVVFEQEASEVVTRMSYGAVTVDEVDYEVKKQILDVPWTFRIYAQSSGSNSAKVVASNIANEIMKKFGGHETESPTAMTLTNHAFVQGQYQNDYGIRVGDNEHMWTVEYTFTLDAQYAV